MNKMFVVVRNDLGNSYKFVQGTHAVAEWMLEYPGVWENKTLVVLQVENEEKLILICERLKIYNKKFVKFFEPDIGNELTSIACCDDGKIFSNLRLA